MNSKETKNNPQLEELENPFYFFSTFVSTQHNRDIEFSSPCTKYEIIKIHNSKLIN